MFQYLKNTVGGLFVCILLVADLCCYSVAQAKDMMGSWQAKAAPIKVVGTTTDGKYPIYAIEGDATDVSYKAAGRLYTSGDLVKKLVFVDPTDAKRYTCEFLCKDRENHTIGINPSFKFLIK